MKKKTGVLIIAAVVLCLCTAVTADPWQRKLPFTQAVIVYELSGSETGREVLYIRDHGERTAHYRTSTTSMFGMTMKNETVVITIPDWVYSFNLQEKTGTKSVNPLKLMIEEYDKLSAAEKKKVDENAKTMGISMMQGMQGSVELNVKEILGYSCDRTNAMGTTVYSIHNTSIPLLTEMNMMGISMNSTATSLKKNGADEQYFEFPQGIEPVPDPQADEMARVMAEQTIAMLKDPEAFKQEHKSAVAPTGAIAPEDQQKMEEAMDTLKGLFGK